jgi:hypothetical protein
MINRYSRNVFGGNAPSFVDSNGFNLATNTWDADNTWMDSTFLTRGVDRLTGKYWGQQGNDWIVNWDPVTDTEAQQFRGFQFIGAPWCFHPTTKKMFALNWGDGMASGSGISAFLIDTSSKTAISFNSSSALTQFQTDGPAYAALEWDWINRYFIFYEAKEGKEQRFYIIRPNATTTWDMELLTVTSGSDIPAYGLSASAGALCNKFKYVPALRGFIHLGRGSYPLAFLRTY